MRSPFVWRAYHARLRRYAFVPGVTVGPVVAGFGFGNDSLIPVTSQDANHLVDHPRLVMIAVTAAEANRKSNGFIDPRFQHLFDHHPEAPALLIRANPTLAGPS